jgi:hypothetical protein
MTTTLTMHDNTKHAGANLVCMYVVITGVPLQYTMSAV